MASKKVVIADASPLIVLARIGRLEWLRTLYRSVLITRAVRGEILVPGQPGADALAAAIKKRWIRQVRSAPKQPQFARLDDGEASVLRVAHKFGADALVILDDLAARREARRLGIEFIGTAGVIVEASTAGLIERATPIFEQLAAEGFHLSAELVDAILAELGGTLSIEQPPCPIAGIGIASKKCESALEKLRQVDQRPPQIAKCDENWQ